MWDKTLRVASTIQGLMERPMTSKSNDFRPFIVGIGGTTRAQSSTEREMKRAGYIK